MSTTTNPVPDVPLPAGALSGDDWEGDGPERVITGPNRGITDSYVYIWTSPIQRADGQVALNPEAPRAAYRGEARLIISDLARELAAVLLEAATERDWRTRDWGTDRSSACHRRGSSQCGHCGHVGDRPRGPSMRTVRCLPVSAEPVQRRALHPRWNCRAAMGCRIVRPQFATRLLTDAIPPDHTAAGERLLGKRIKMLMDGLSVWRTPKKHCGRLLMKTCEARSLAAVLIEAPDVIDDLATI
jgi:hypothetical protein